MSAGEASTDHTGRSTLTHRDIALHRRRVIAAALVICAGKLILSATTYGTNDIRHWFDFLDAVQHVGPIAVYSAPLHGSLYNHPPLIGYYLQFIGAGTHVGLSANFLIRAISSLADVATAVLVFELLRRRRTLRDATLAGLVVACSPVLVIISGFHGNTDPIFTMLVFLGVYLLADRRAPVLAGVTLALALGVKIVPVVVIPCLLIYGLHRGRATLLRFVAAFVGVSAIFWVPALLQQWSAIMRNVIGYSGSTTHVWGLAVLGKIAEDPFWAPWIEGPGRLLVVAVCAVLPALVVWRRPDALVQGVALSVAGLLALTPTFGTQYLVWGAAAAALLTPRGGLAFNVLGGALLAEVYTRWNGGLPWDRAYALSFTSGEEVFGLLVWAVLIWSLIEGARHLPARFDESVEGAPSQPLAREPGSRLAVDRSDHEFVARTQ